MIGSMKKRLMSQSEHFSILEVSLPSEPPENKHNFEGNPRQMENVPGFPSKLKCKTFSMLSSLVGSVRCVFKQKTKQDDLRS